MLPTVEAPGVDSANLRHGTSYQCRHLANQYEWMSVNHFPYLPIVTIPETIPVSRRWSVSPPKF